MKVTANAKAVGLDGLITVEILKLGLQQDLTILLVELHRLPIHTQAVPSRPVPVDPTLLHTLQKQ